ncbi:MAG: hypothetical protein SGARI_000738 [Bacillariaceae sp.]
MRTAVVCESVRELLHILLIDLGELDTVAKEQLSELHHGAHEPNAVGAVATGVVGVADFEFIEVDPSVGGGVSCSGVGSAGPTREAEHNEMEDAADVASLDSVPYSWDSSLGVVAEVGDFVQLGAEVNEPCGSEDKKFCVGHVSHETAKLGA